ATAQGMTTVVATGDKDLGQLVNEHVILVDSMSRDGGPARVLDLAGVQEKFGVPANRIVDYLTLVGDTVDNIPGVEKVGPKTAAKWLAEHGSLDAVVAAADSISGVVGQNLRKALDWLPTARELVTVKTDCDLSSAITSFDESLTMQPLDTSVLAQLRDDYDLQRTFKGLAGDDGSSPHTAQARSSASFSASGADHAYNNEPQPSQPTSDLFAESIPTHYTTVQTQQALTSLIEKLMAASIAAFDTETSSLEARHAELVGLSFCVDRGEAFYIPLSHVDATGSPEPGQLDLQTVLNALKPWFERSAQAKLAQNFKYDAHVLKRYGIHLQGSIHDTLLQSYVIEAHKSHDLGSLAERHLGRRGLSYDDVTGKGASRINFRQVDIAKASQYSCEDADFTLHLHETLWPQIQADAKLKLVYETIEIPAMLALIDMEEAGILIDADKLNAQSNELAKTIADLETQAHELAGQPFNLGSPKQLGEILFEKLGYKPVKKTAKGAPSTDEDVLETLAQDYPLPKTLLEWRGLSKLKSTYTDKLPRMVDPNTGRVHTTFSQAVAVTGRLASSEPNLQNIPIRNAEGRRIRQAFIAPEGHTLVSADYSQIELRIMAHLSEDKGLLEAFSKGEDVHRATASEIFGTPKDEVTSEQRRYAKVINFGLIYGMSAFGLAQNLDIEREAARLYIERYFNRYPGVASYMESIKAQARQQGYVETVFGRRLWLGEIRSPNGPRRAAAERAAINAPMQGTAADLIKLAMIQLQVALRDQGLETRMLLQVHDELVLEAPHGELETLQTLLPQVMTSVASLKVPLEVSVGHGPNWD
ncbi:MAG: DNA polymerase I, partial [Burkholderiaceae bacterium]